MAAERARKKGQVPSGIDHLLDGGRLQDLDLRDRVGIKAAGSVRKLDGITGPELIEAAEMALVIVRREDEAACGVPSYRHGAMRRFG